MHLGPMAEESRISLIGWRPLVIRLAVVALLVALNSFVAEGGVWLFQQVRPAGRSLLFFSLAWQGAEWPLLAVWLAWSTGSSVERFSLALAMIALRVAFFRWWLTSVDEKVFPLLWYVLFSLVVVLGLHGLLRPLRECTSWRLVAGGSNEVSAVTWQWSMRQLLIWTALLAIPLAISQLASQLIAQTDSTPLFWLILGSDVASGTLIAGIVAVALLSERLAWRFRLAIVAAAPLVAFGSRALHTWLFNYRERAVDCAWWGAGLACAAVFNVLVLRGCGLRWRRMAAPAEDITN